MKCAKYLLLYFPGLLHYLRECTCIVATDILVINLRVAQALSSRWCLLIRDPRGTYNLQLISYTVKIASGNVRLANNVANLFSFNSVKRQTV